MKNDSYLTTATFVNRDLIDIIFKKIFTKYKITFFSLTIHYPNIPSFMISTDRNWGKHWKINYEHIDSFTKTEIVKNYKYYIWGTNPQRKEERVMHEDRTFNFKIPPGISLVETVKDLIITFSFSSNQYEDSVAQLFRIGDELRIAGHQFLEEIKDLVFAHEKKYSYKKTLLLASQDIIIQEANLSANYKLTPTELTIFSLLSHGQKPKTIAHYCKITPDTVRRHVSHVMKKLNCMDKTHAIAKLLRAGIIL